ncbi:MAG TPA: nucleotidyltransferase domain-containing protein [Coriobacteriia bacterium]
MRATHDIESIFGTRSRTRVLRVLHGVSVPLNTAQVARHAGLSQPAASSALAELESIGLVMSNRVGWAKVHWIVRENAYVQRIVDPVFLAQEALGDELERDLRDAFGPLCVSVVVFGSYARDEQEEDSDIDVVLVASDADAKAQVDEAATVQANFFYRRWGASLSPLIYDLAQAAALCRTAPSLFADIERDGVVVSGLWPYEWSRHAPS